MIIGICDDESGVRLLVENYIRRVDSTHTVLHFKNGNEVLKYQKQSGNLDLLYLDIDLAGEPDGMEVAFKLKEERIKEGTALSALPLIIFITGFPERMHEAFSVHAFHFLIKPLDEYKFRMILMQATKAAQKIGDRVHDRNVLEIMVNGKIKRIPTEIIRYIESSGRKIKLHLTDHVIEYYGRISDAKNELNGSFCQIHRSFIVNMAYVFNYRRTVVELTDGTEIPMSKYKYGDFIKKYMVFEV